MNSFLQGLRDAKKGISYFIRHASLWKFAIFPAIINIILFCVVLIFLAKNFHHMVGILTQSLDLSSVNQDSFLYSIVSAILWFVRGLIYLLGGLILLIVTFILSLFLSQIINSPFYDLLSEKVESIENPNFKPEPFSLKTFLNHSVKTVLTEIKKIIILTLIPAITMLLYFIPVIGAILQAVIGQIYAAWALGFNFISYPMTRKILPFQDQLKIGYQAKIRMIGFGLILLLPFVNLILSPCFVVGGTLIYLEIGKNQIKKI